MELMRDLWRGDVPLVKVYWLFGVLPGFVFNLAFTFIQAQGLVLASRLAALCFLVVLLFFYAYSVFICIAIWRSANKYTGLARYAILAKVAVVFGVMALIKSLADILGASSHPQNVGGYEHIHLSRGCQ